MIREAGRTVRAAIKSWSATARTCVLVTVPAATTISYHVLVRR
jgi:hypothetical protein